MIDGQGVAGAEPGPPHTRQFGTRTSTRGVHRGLDEQRRLALRRGGPVGCSAIESAPPASENVTISLSRFLCVSPSEPPYARPDMPTNGLAAARSAIAVRGTTSRRSASEPPWKIDALDPDGSSSLLREDRDRGVELVVVVRIAHCAFRSNSARNRSEKLDLAGSDATVRGDHPGAGAADLAALGQHEEELLQATPRVLPMLPLVRVIVSDAGMSSTCARDGGGGGEGCSSAGVAGVGVVGRGGSSARGPCRSRRARARARYPRPGRVLVYVSCPPSTHAIAVRANFAAGNARRARRTRGRHGFSAARPRSPRAPRARRGALPRSPSAESSRRWR